MTEKKFRGYSTAVGAFIINFCNLGIASTIGVCLPYLVQTTGAEVGVLSLVVSIATIAAFVASFLVAKFNEKIGQKGVLYVCLLLLVPYMLCPALATSFVPMIFHSIAGGFFLCFGTTATLSICVSKWFITKRSAILGIVLGGGGLGAAAFQFLAGRLCEIGGPRLAYLVMLAIGIIVPLLVNVLLIRDPEKLGQKPLGFEEAAKQTAENKELPGIEFGKARKTVAFWLCMLAVLLSGPLITGFQTFATSYWRSYGMEGGYASTLVSIWSLIGAVAVILLGQVANRFGNKIYMSIINIAYIVGMIFVILWPSNQSIVYLVLAIIFVGLSYPLTNALPAMIATDTFGPKDYAKIVSWFVAMLYLGKAIASPLVSGIVKATGSYVTAFIILAVFSAICLILGLLAMAVTPYRKAKTA